jgi:hypothetical protein
MSNTLKVNKRSKKLSNIERIAVLEKTVTRNYILINKLYEALGSSDEAAEDDSSE